MNYYLVFGIGQFTLGIYTLSRYFERERKRERQREKEIR